MLICSPYLLAKLISLNSGCVSELLWWTGGTEAEAGGFGSRLYWYYGYFFEKTQRTFTFYFIKKIEFFLHPPKRHVTENGEELLAG
jgi:hypothetical protein